MDSLEVDELVDLLPWKLVEAEVSINYFHQLQLPRPYSVEASKSFHTPLHTSIYFYEFHKLPVASIRFPQNVHRLSVLPRASINFHELLHFSQTFSNFHRLPSTSTSFHVCPPTSTNYHIDFHPFPLTYTNFHIHFQRLVLTSAYHICFHWFPRASTQTSIDFYDLPHHETYWLRLFSTSIDFHLLVLTYLLPPAPIDFLSILPYVLAPTSVDFHPIPYLLPPITYSYLLPYLLPLTYICSIDFHALPYMYFHWLSSTSADFRWLPLTSTQTCIHFPFTFTGFHRLYIA